MILPIYAYGQPVLKKVGEPIYKDYPQLSELIQNMWDTMYLAKGVGLAAPQIGLSIKLFIVDTVQIQEEGEEEKGIKKVFINPEILEESGNEWAYEEGCLSIPNLNADVNRLEEVFVKYLDENFVEHTEKYNGMNARVIQHEYDHIQGVLFIEKINPLRRRLFAKKLDNIRKGKISASYKLKFLQ